MYNFSEVCEAYEVLISPKLRTFYDQFGEEVLKNGLPVSSSGIKGGYAFAGNSMEIF